MEENRNQQHDHNRDDDQLRENTMNETIREQTGRENLSGAGGAGSDGYTPNDASAVRSGGTTDMDDQAAGGAGLASGRRPGSGSNITTKRNVTGSDYDGQVKTS